MNLTLSDRPVFLVFALLAGLFISAHGVATQNYVIIDSPSYNAIISNWAPCTMGTQGPIKNPPPWSYQLQLQKIPATFLHASSGYPLQNGWGWVYNASASTMGAFACTSGVFSGSTGMEVINGIYNYKVISGSNQNIFYSLAIPEKDQAAISTCTIGYQSGFFVQCVYKNNT